jgi:hypothetical protein
LIAGKERDRLGNSVFENSKLILTQVVYGIAARVDNYNVKPNFGARWILRAVDLLRLNGRGKKDQS